MAPAIPMDAHHSTATNAGYRSSSASSPVLDSDGAGPSSSRASSPSLSSSPPDTVAPPPRSSRALSRSCSSPLRDTDRPSSSSLGPPGGGTPAPASPSSTSVSDDMDEFVDLAGSGFNLDDRRMTLTKDRPRPSSLVPQSPTSTTESWLHPQNSLPGSVHPPSPAANLPHEILLHVFKFVAVHPPDLASCLQVCKSWCLCGVELLWYRPTFYRLSALVKLIRVIQSGRDDSMDESGAVVSQNGNWSDMGSGDAGAPGPTSRPIFEYATFIRRLNFTALGEGLEDNLFGRLTPCERLERLTLAGCSAVEDATLTKVLSHTPRIVAIDLSGVTNCTDTTLDMLGRTCARLQGISLAECKEITDAGMARLARSCKLLRRVKLCGCVNIGDETVTTMAESCPMLLEVDLSGCASITNEGAIKLWQHSYHMRELRFARCSRLTDAAFPEPWPRSNVLNGGGGFGDAITGSPAHRNARSSRSKQDRPPSVVPGTLGAPRMFDHLRILDITNCASITDKAIEGIVTNVPRLRNLSLSKCIHLTDDGVFSICKLGKHLHFLQLGHCGNITDRAVTALARSCTRLRYLDLACCMLLTDLSVFELAVHLPKLRRIGLVRVANLTDEAIYALVDRHTALERIHLSYCEKISVQAIFWLLTRLHRLTHLSLTGVPSFRRPDLQQMCRQPPKDFTEHQREAFCVYSGRGIHDLRRYLLSQADPQMQRQIALTDHRRRHERHGRHGHHGHGHGQSQPRHHDGGAGGERASGAAAQGVGNGHFADLFGPSQVHAGPWAADFSGTATWGGAGGDPLDGPPGASAASVQRQRARLARASADDVRQSAQAAGRSAGGGMWDAAPTGSQPLGSPMQGVASLVGGLTGAVGGRQTPRATYFFPSDTVGGWRAVSSPADAPGLPGIPTARGDVQPSANGNGYTFGFANGGAAGEAIRTPTAGPPASPFLPQAPFPSAARREGGGLANAPDEAQTRQAYQQEQMMTMRMNALLQQQSERLAAAEALTRQRREEDGRRERRAESQQP